MLRDYQIQMLERLERAWTGRRSVLVQMPTGTGKTVLMAEAIRRETSRTSQSGSVLVVAHRRELIDQIRQTIALFGLQGVRVESIQKLNANQYELDFEPVLVIVDEAHHAVAKTYRTLWKRWPQARFLGLTATPCRLSGEGLSGLFDTMLQSLDIQQFIDAGWLSDFEYLSARPDSLAMHRIGLLRKRGADGDYQVKEMATVMDVPESIEHLFRSYEAFAKGRKGIVYAIDRQHAQHIAAYYGEHGVKACVIDAKTPAKDRGLLVEAYRDGQVDVIVNVDIFSEGFDCPEVEFIQLARPTLSLSKYLQQVGRGMRVSKGKACVMILDQVGLYQTLGLPTDSRDWQEMFEGRQAGKAQAGMEHPVVIRHAEDMKAATTLVNLEMVHIKRRGEKHEGPEVFMLGGKYGVMVNGNIRQDAAFEHVEWLGAPYFVMGTYPYPVYKSKVTVIDREGRDLKPGLYGHVRQTGDVFVGKDQRGTTTYWDAKGGRRYRQMPEFDRIRRFEVAKAGDEMYLRKMLKGWETPFSAGSVYLGDYFTILGNVLVYGNDLRQTYRIKGYQADYIYVESDDAPGYKYGEIGRRGDFVGRRNFLPEGMSNSPDLVRLGLKRL